MFYYIEPVKREPNHRGTPRLVSVLGGLPGAQGRGFDVDGLPPKRGEEAGHNRLWGFGAALATPLPDGVVQLTQTAFDNAIADREAAKPVPAIPGPTPKELYAALTSLEQKVAMLAEVAGLVEGI